jgi:hypothetical protein
MKLIVRKLTQIPFEPITMFLSSIQNSVILTLLSSNGVPCIALAFPESLGKHFPVCAFDSVSSKITSISVQQKISFSRSPVQTLQLSKTNSQFSMIKHRIREHIQISLKAYKSLREALKTMHLVPTVSSIPNDFVFKSYMNKIARVTPPAL